MMLLQLQQWQDKGSSCSSWSRFEHAPADSGCSNSNCSLNHSSNSDSSSSSHGHDPTASAAALSSAQIKQQVMHMMAKQPALATV